MMVFDAIYFKYSGLVKARSGRSREWESLVLKPSDLTAFIPITIGTVRFFMIPQAFLYFKSSPDRYIIHNTCLLWQSIDRGCRVQQYVLLQ